MTINKRGPLARGHKITIDDENVAFIPIKECPFTEGAAATVPNFTFTQIFSPTEPNDVDDYEWQNVIMAIVPSFIVAGLVSACYVCYRSVHCTSIF